MAPSPDNDQQTDPGTWRGAITRWVIVAAVALGGTFLVRKLYFNVRARSATRVVLTDFARFEGCLLGVPFPGEAGAADRAMQLARGTGDAAWPHSCSPHLTRLEHSADDIASDDSAARGLAISVREMENALGVAVWWTQHVQEGSREAPGWIASYIALRRTVAAYAAAHGAQLLAPEASRRPRIPNPVEAAEPPPRPVAVPGGDEADLLDSIATPREIAFALRDRRNRYTICRYPLARSDAHLGCSVLEIPRIADPRYAGFVPSERGAFFAIWGRAPYSLRGLVDLDTRHVDLISGGNPEAMRDYWVGPEKAVAVQITGQGAALIVAEGGATREVAMPESLDVVAEERALVGTPTGASVVWLDARMRARAELHAAAIGLSAEHAPVNRVIATWAEPRLTGLSRRIMPCSVPGGPAYLLAGDDRGAFLFVTSDGTRFERGPEVPRGIDRHTQLVCDERGVSIAKRGANGLDVTHCDHHACGAMASVPADQAYSLARSAGTLLVADSAGSAGAATVRRIAPGGAVSETARFALEPPLARALQMAARGSTVVLMAAATATFALISHDGGATFAPAVIDR